MKNKTRFAVLLFVFLASMISVAQDSQNLIAIIPDFQVNENGGPIHDGSAISLDCNGNFAITWLDKRNGDFDIYAQRYTSDGTALSNNFRVNDDQGSGEQWSPAISMDCSGNYVITWGPDNRTGAFDIYAQRYTVDGTQLGANFKVNDSQGEGSSPAVSMDCSRNFVITWEDNNSGASEIYAQRYLSDGTALGSNFKVNDSQGEGSSPAISMDCSGSFVIVWADSRTNDSEIYAQRYSNDGTALGSSFRVNDDLEEIALPAISTDGSGNFVITWTHGWGSNRIIYAQRYAADGTRLGNNFRVNNKQGSAHNRFVNSAISTDNSGNFVITWALYANGHDIYAQRYLSDGTTVGGNFLVTNTGSESRRTPDVKFWNNRIYNTWTRIGASGYDIWANVLEFDNPTGISDNKRYQIPSVFVLNQNYPNPFNPSTKISYSIPKSGFIILKVYDMLGREIQTLVNKFQKANTYSVNFDARELSSGIYFYKLQTGNNFVETKKMLLLK